LYIGRFAPTPSGPLHFGSIVTALASFLDAKHNKGIWKIRIDDIDTPRVVKDAELSILKNLENLGLFWDDKIFKQSENIEEYKNNFEILSKKNLTYNCQCTRKKIAKLNQSITNIDEPIYNNYCRNKKYPSSNISSVRLITNYATTNFLDKTQGFQANNINNKTGDFIIKRSDQVYSYQLATVIDDELQSITNIVRGSDLLSSTIKQHYINTLLDFSKKNYMHIPIATINNKKISKGNGDKLNTNDWSLIIIEGLKFLKQNIQKNMEDACPEEILKYASKNWNIKPLKQINSIELNFNQRSFVDNIHT
jgi:glutamyl-Q tRNA(Asp) synthetase